MWVGVLVALLVGGVVGYLLGWGLGAPEAKTVTVTDTTTETVAPPSYATGEFGATVRFVGDQCMYSGPAEQPAGTRVDISFPGPGGSSLVLLKVEGGTTYEDAVKDAFVFGGSPPFSERIESSPDPWRQEIHEKLSEGLWLVGCTNPNSNRVFTATMLRMVPR